MTTRIARIPHSLKISDSKIDTEFDLEMILNWLWTDSELIQCHSNNRQPFEGKRVRRMMKGLKGKKKKKFNWLSNPLNVFSFIKHRDQPDRSAYRPEK